MFGRILTGLIGVPLGILMVVKAHYIVNNIVGGTFDWAERYLGSTGTYTFFRLLGLAITVLSFLIMIGAANWIYDAFAHPLGGILHGL